MAKNNNKKNAYKGGKTGKRGKGYANKMDAERESTTTVDKASTKGPGRNDLSWYTRNAALVESAAKIPFALQPGRVREWSEIIELGGRTTNFSNKFKYPGIMTLGFNPCVGRSADIGSPINVAAREIYGQIRSKYSGGLEADAPDLMMYILAVDSALMYYEDVKRAYYLLNQYTPYNNYLPSAMIRALGYDFEDLLNNKTKLFQGLVEMGAKLGKFMVPDIMPLFKRHSWMVSNIYADSSNAKAQIYAFKMNGYYALKHTETMTELEAVDNTVTQYKTAAQAIDDLRYLTEKLMAWDTAYTILGYFMRAYEGTTFLLPSPVIQDGVLGLVYNEDVLYQIHNATVVPVDVSSLGVTQDPVNGNILKSVPYSPNDNYLKGCILNLPGSDQPSAAAVIEATRLTTLMSPENGQLECGTEILSSMNFYDDIDGVPNATYDHSLIVTGDNPSANIAWTLSQISRFRLHPHVYVMLTTGNQDDMQAKVYDYTDLENATFVDHADVEDLHRMCIYSEFNCFSN